MTDASLEQSMAIARLLGLQPGDETWEGFIHWLVLEADPDDRHRVALDWNWDAGFEVLAWIGRRPDCDRTTALLMFWNGQPEYYVEFQGERERVPSVNRRGFDFLEEPRRRWREARYARSELAFSLDDPSTWPRDFAALDAAFGDRARIEMPLDMREPVQGRAVTSDGYIEGIPTRFWSTTIQP